MIFKKNCLNCNKEMIRTCRQEANRTNWKFCSLSCSTIYNNKHRIWKKESIEKLKKSLIKPISGYKKCVYCEKLFPYRDSLKIRGSKGIASEKQKFCSRKCSLIHRNKSDIQRLKVSIKTKGRKSPIKGRKLNIEQRLIRKLNNSGSKSHFWKGGITPENLEERRGLKLKLWREYIFERDDYRCFDCGERGGKLQAHHIYSFSEFKRLRFDKNNGITLCLECHRKTDNYGVKSSRRKATMSLAKYKS